MYHKCALVPIDIFPINSFHLLYSFFFFFLQHSHNTVDNFPKNFVFQSRFDVNFDLIIWFFLNFVFCRHSKLEVKVLADTLLIDKVKTSMFLQSLHMAMAMAKPAYT